MHTLGWIGLGHMGEPMAKKSFKRWIQGKCL